MLTKNLLILDCDGVLIRSERANRAYYNRLFFEFGLPPVARMESPEGRLLHTLSTPQVIDHFFSEEARPAARAFADSLDFAEFIPLIDPEPGWREYLSACRSSLRVCVATNRGRSAAQVLEAVGLSPLVDRLVTVNDVKRPKPAPDMLLMALDHFGAPAACAVYVGDSELDRSASAAAGIAFVGFRLAGEFCIEGPQELKDVIKFP